MKAKHEVRIPKADEERLLSLCKLAIEKIMPGNAFVAALPSLFIQSTHSLECRHHELEQPTSKLESPTLNGESLTSKLEPLTLNGESLTSKLESLTSKLESPTLDGESLSSKLESLTLDGESLTSKLESLILKWKSRNRGLIQKKQIKSGHIGFFFLSYCNWRVNGLYVESRHPP